MSKGKSGGSERRVKSPNWTAGSMVTQPVAQSIAPPQDEKRPYLTILVGGVPGRMFRLEAGRTTVGRGDDCSVRLQDPSLSRHHCEIQVLPSGAVTVSDRNSTNGSWVNGEPLRARDLRDGDKLQLGPDVVMRFNNKDSLDESFQKSQFEAMTRDGLTGCFNRRYFDTEVRREVDMALSIGLPMSVAMVDLDHFKNVNDTYGHGAGDKVLQDVASILLRALRAYDIVARYGGEEFALVMRGIDMNIASRCMERVRSSIEKHVCVVNEHRIRLTISAGIASLSETNVDDVASLLSAADLRMYAAKRGGRNRVVGGEVDLASVRHALSGPHEAHSPRNMKDTIPRGSLRLKDLDELAAERETRRKTLPSHVRRSPVR